MVVDKLKRYVQNLIKISVCALSLVYIFLVVIDLTYFLSYPTKLLDKPPHEEKWMYSAGVLLTDMLLITVFIVQHSLLASKTVSNFFKSVLDYFGLQEVYRSIYITTTALALQFLMKNWLTTSDPILWQFNFNFKPVWWLYIGIHSVAWILIYVGNICTDITELLGIKQVRYGLSDIRKDPNELKSRDLRKLYSHMRHPSFVAFVLIFWLCPVMSLDRLLLASILTLYMCISWNTDQRDYNYQKYQYIRKYHELEKLHNY